jgi:DNA-binding response OmpR family regulator
LPVTVLIVEDEADLGALLADVLRGAGFDVVLTTSGRAEERVRNSTPAAIVTDFMMPGMNGAQVIERIRKALSDATPPVVLVTGMDNPEELAARMGAAAFLRKPFDMDDFVDTVRRVVDEGALLSP